MTLTDKELEMWERDFAELERIDGKSAPTWVKVFICQTLSSQRASLMEKVAGLKRSENEKDYDSGREIELAYEYNQALTDILALMQGEKP